MGEGDDGPELGQGDWLEGGADSDVLLGDGFDIDANAWAPLVASFTTFVASGNLAFSIDLTPTGSGGDVLEGGEGDTLIIGGDGEDAINAGNGRALIFGDAFSFTLGSEESFAVGLSGVIDHLSVSSFLFSDGGGFSLDGNGNDLIHGGSGGNAIIGGGGNDWIWGHDESPADFLFGNEGEDHVLAGDGFNFVVGGDGDDPELIGGVDFDIVVGDSLKMPDGSSFTAPDANLLSGTAGILQKLANLFSVKEETVDEEPVLKDMAFGFLIVDSGDDTIRGGDGVNLLFGGPGNDKITGGKDEDVIYGGEGNDSSLNGMDGVDLVVGGAGDDTLRGGTDDAANFLFGDILTVDLGFDLTPLLKGDFKSLTFPRIAINLKGNGEDHIYGGNGFDLIVGGNGVDHLWGQNGADTACSDSNVACQNNNIVFGDDFSTIAKLFSLASDFFGILTNPTSSISTIVNLAKSLYTFFVGSEGDAVDNGDTYEGGNGYDIVLGGDGVDTLNGAGGSDFLIGGYGDDVLDVGDGEQVEPLTIFFGIVKIDEIGWGGHGNDVFFGGTGNDALMSDEGTDRFYGGDGDDVLAGGGDDDMLFGENGNDWLFGEAGHDILDGGPGADKLFGGPGDDTFVSDPEDEIDDPVDRLPGDTNLDGRVDLVDLNNVRNNFGAVAAGVLGDANDDGRVDLQDLNDVRNNFGAIAGGTPMLRERVKPAVAENRERIITGPRREAWDSGRIEARVDDLVFGIDSGLNEHPLSVVDNQLARVIRRRVIRMA